MQILSKNNIFQVKVCSSFISQTRGLMFRSKPNYDGLLFILSKEKKQDLHMFFVFFKIDIIYLNKNKEIIEIKKNVKPFTPHISSPKAKYILELKSSKNLRVGEKFVI